ncbi:hypothetical protein EW146_g4917 [Bondarzewia mesenterica]|uniref:Uncharacterized protein n=1 Tax=Bondarzewia mesenterica TaxID=1095465 RepID=A0A4V3XEZ6_9AGAM|nr:hypothetical protein EW146_g4917 [Bondarzewia mesenterica]
MSSPPDSQGNGQASSSTWTEPPWSGWIETTGDALLILEAARRGLIPRVTRRLVDSERKMITSGSVFVFDEDESGIKRWTDGFFWSPSRILGNFLLYRETEKKGTGHRGARVEAVSDEVVADGGKLEGQTLSRPRGEASRLGIDRHRERSLVGSLTNSYKFKSGGMMKKTFSLTINGVSQHLISYYKIEDVEQGRLRSPSSYPELASLDISPEYLDKTHFRNPPKVEIGMDGLPRYRGEADDVEPSPHLVTTPSGMPILSAPTDIGGTAGGKRNKRFDPYGVGSKRSRKGKNAQSQMTSPTEVGYAVGGQTGYADPSVTIQHHYAAAFSMPPPHTYYQMGYGVNPHTMYPPGAYAPPSAVSPPATTGSPTSPLSSQPAGTPTSPTGASAQGYPTYMTPPIGDTSQQAYYGYYPPPPGYSSYWPTYAGYGPPQMVSPTVPVENVVADVVAPNAEHKVVDTSAVQIVDGDAGLAAVEA